MTALFSAAEKGQKPLVKKRKSPGFDIEQIDGILGMVGQLLKALGQCPDNVRIIDVHPGTVSTFQFPNPGFQFFICGFAGHGELKKGMQVFPGCSMPRWQPCTQPRERLDDRR